MSKFSFFFSLGGRRNFYWQPDIFAGYQFFRNSWNPGLKLFKLLTFFKREQNVDLKLLFSLYLQYLCHLNRLQCQRLHLPTNLIKFQLYIVHYSLFFPLLFVYLLCVYGRGRGMQYVFNPKLLYIFYPKFEKYKQIDLRT